MYHAIVVLYVGVFNTSVKIPMYMLVYIHDIVLHMHIICMRLIPLGGMSGASGVVYIAVGTCIAFSSSFARVLHTFTVLQCYSD